MDEPPRHEVRIADPGEVAAALPHLLGFAPHESVVLVCLGGSSGGRVGLTVRADLPPPARSAALARALARSVTTDRPAAVVLAVVSERSDEPADGLPHRAVVHDLVLALDAAGLPVPLALLVRRGRWWSYDCPHACCAPAAGTPLPAGITELEVASVATGTVVEPDRAALVARIAPSDGPAAAAMAEACLRAGRAHAARVRDAGRSATSAESWSAVTAAVARCRPGGPQVRSRLTDAEVARVVWGLRDTDVRDLALGLAVGADAVAAQNLWTECTRRAPAPLDAAPATLLAVSAWLRGDGAMANVALDRALDSDPGYRLAGLLAQALAACVPPAELRALIGATVADLDGSRVTG